MNGIQALLIGGVMLIFLYYAFHLRSAVVDLVLLLLFSGLAIFFILVPEDTNIIAHKLGVGRGADLLFYVCILLFLFIVMKLFSRIRRLEKMLTQLVRQEAKDHATFPDEGTAKTDMKEVL